MYNTQPCVKGKTAPNFNSYLFFEIMIMAVKHIHKYIFNKANSFFVRLYDFLT